MEAFHEDQAATENRKWDKKKGSLPKRAPLHVKNGLLLRAKPGCDKP